MNNRILVSLSYIDLKYIDEHIYNAVEGKSKHTPKIRYIIAACLVIVSCLIITLTFFKRDGKNLFSNYKSEEIFESLELPLKPEEKVSVIYRNAPYNGINGDVYISPPLDGDVQVDIDLFEVLESEEIKENDVLAIRVCCVSSKYLDEQLAKKKTDLTQGVVKYYLDYTRHSQEMHSGENKQFIEGCNECKRLYDIYTGAEENFENDLKAFEAKQRDLIENRVITYLESLGYVVKNGTIVWGNCKIDTESQNTERYILVYLTKEQIYSLTAPADIGLILEHAPSWMDTGEELVFHEPLIVLD
ncbi:MAG: hypothetical protein IKU48_00150 [Clostridia bacterium]|nr:hypothetical protein [Clostridia bacterium]